MKLLMEKVMSAEIIPDSKLLPCVINTHQTEAPSQDAPALVPVSGNVDRENVIGNVAGSVVPADTVKSLFEMHVHLWEVAESFESCRKMPQDPHFRLLSSCREILREGQALSKMVTFDNIAKKTSNLRSDIKIEAIEDDLSLLEELEMHGFDVEILKSRLNRLLLLKKQQEMNKNKLEERKKRLSGHDQKKCEIKEKRAKLEERMKDLQKEYQLAAKMEKDFDAKIASEQLEVGVNHEKLCSIKREIEELVASSSH